MVGGEDHFPYDRPPLSKHYLAGAWDAEKLRLRAAADPAALGVEWRLGTKAIRLDLGLKTVELDDGDTLSFDGLVIATGASPRSIPGIELDGVHVLRTLDDAVALRADFDASPERVLVIGADETGAEVAATARQRGLEVTMVDAAETPMSRVLDRVSGLAVADLHRSHGVDVRLGVGVAGMESDAFGRVNRVELSDGESVVVDVVVIGIGVTPNTGWLEGSGLELDNGVVCDATCLAAPGVVAAGDVARWPNRRFGGELTRVEQWDNAIDQGGYAAKRLLAWAADEPESVEPFEPIPWFWSDQYDRKMQLAGVPTDRTEVVQGSLAEQRFVQIYTDDQERFVGALAWNRPRQAIQARQLLTERATVEQAREVLGA